MGYKYVFWDFNGTIIDDVENGLGCVNDMLKRRNKKPITLSDYYSYVETPIIGFYRHILPPEELDFPQISKEYHEDYARRMCDTHLAEGAKELLEKLHKEGVKQYIITANHIDETTDLVNRFGISKYIEKIAGAEDALADSKTERAKKLFKELNINRNDAIFVGDTLHDFETANALGIDCVLVSYGHQGKRLLQENSAYTVDSLRDVDRIIHDDRKIDLHNHSTCSDGTMTPTELVYHAKEMGLSAFALTDHDSVDGIEEAQKAAKEIGMELIPGIEFSAAQDTETHIIGLYLDIKNPTLLKTIASLKENRIKRMEDICSKLRSLGFDITYSDAKKIAGGTFVGRPHIAKAMVEKGYCKDIKECFNKYIGLGKPAYSEKTELSAVDAVKAIREAGGVAFLAHLHQTGYDLSELEKLLLTLKEAGLNGVEGYYTEYTPEHIESYRNLAIKLKLAIGGGSDYHAKMKPHIEMGIGTGNLAIPYFILDNIKEIRNRKKD